MIKFPFYPQLDVMDCGATCLRMVARHYGRSFPIDYLRKLTVLEKEGASLTGISEAAEKIGLRALGVKVTFEQLAADVPLPCIAHWEQNHFIVIIHVTKSYVWIADPAIGKLKIRKKSFLEGWLADTQLGDEAGILLLLEATPDFLQKEKKPTHQKPFFSFFNLLAPHKKLIFHLSLGLFFGAIIQLLFLLLIQSVVDIGITNQDISFLYRALFALSALFIAQFSLAFFRDWIWAHLDARINKKSASEGLKNLINRPFRFFEAKPAAVFWSRMLAQQTEKYAPTTNFLLTFFWLLYLVFFGVILFFYHVAAGSIFFIFSMLYFLWISFFFKKRQILGQEKTEQRVNNLSFVTEFICGIADIKLNNAEEQKQKEWEQMQTKASQTELGYFAHEPYQQLGASLIVGIKNIFILFVVLKASVAAQMTLGAMAAIYYIVGQLDAALVRLVKLMVRVKEEEINVSQIREIDTKKNTDDFNGDHFFEMPFGDITFEKVNFRHADRQLPAILRNIYLTLPAGKKTAIVGASGSGKTTLLQLLLRLYEPTEGILKVGDCPFSFINPALWHSKCGAVLQDGFIFADTIAYNISIGEDEMNEEKLQNALKIANLQNFIRSLPLGFHTKIGANGMGLSQGQKQRLLIARAVYKNPDYLFFDEATNALDAYNELMIMENLAAFCPQKTIVFVAHRLSTVKYADHIVVMEDGEVMEQGTHLELLNKKGAYYFLLKYQL